MDNFFERTVKFLKEINFLHESGIKDGNNMSIEDFELQDNLMIPCGILVNKGHFFSGKSENIYTDLSNFERLCEAIFKTYSYA